MVETSNPAPAVPNPSARWPALMETALAGSLAVLLGWWMESYWHLIVAALLVPLSCLQSPASKKLGLKILQRNLEAWDNPRRFLQVITAILGSLLLVSLALWQQWPSNVLLGLALLPFLSLCQWVLAGARVLAALISSVVTFYILWTLVPGWPERWPDSLIATIYRGAYLCFLYFLGLSVVILLASVVGFFASSLFDLLATSALVRAVLFFLFMLLGCPLIRMAITVVFLLKHPMNSVRRVPLNWWRQIALESVSTPPEMMPGLNNSQLQSSMALQHLQFRNWLFDTDRYSNASLGGSIILIATNVAITLTYSFIFFIPSYIYRLSVKSTVLIWWPLIWCISPKKLLSKLKLTLIARSNWGESLKQASFWLLSIAMSIVALLLFENTMPTWLPLTVSVPEIGGNIDSLTVLFATISAALVALSQLLMFYRADYLLIHLEMDSIEKPRNHYWLISVLQRFQLVMAITCCICLGLSLANASC